MASNVSPLHYQIQLVIIQRLLNHKVKAEQLHKKALVQKQQGSVVTQLRKVDLFHQLGQIAVIHHHGQTPALQEDQAHQQVLEDPLRLQAVKRIKKHHHAMELDYAISTWSISLMSEFRLYEIFLRIHKFL